MKSVLNKLLVLLAFLNVSPIFSQTISINESYAKSQSSLRNVENAKRILEEQDYVFIDVSYIGKSISINSDRQDDIDYDSLIEEIKRYLNDRKIKELPVIKYGKYKVVVESISASSIMSNSNEFNKSCPKILDLLTSTNYFVYLAFSSNLRSYSMSTIFKAMLNHEKRELNDLIDAVIHDYPHESMSFYLSKLGHNIKLSTGKNVRMLSGYLVDGSPKQYLSGSRNTTVKQVINSFKAHGIREVVSAWNFDSNKIESHPIVRTFRTLGDKILIVSLKNEKNKINTTHNHPFFVAGKGWVKAAELKSGDVLISKNVKMTVSSTHSQKLRNPIYLYNLEVAKYNNYFVMAQGKNSDAILVHNCNEDETFNNTDPIPEQEASSFDHVCFTGDTQIKLRDADVSISLVEEGDEVLACNDSTNTCEYKHVKKKYHSYTNDLVYVKPKGAIRPIKSTPNHPYYVFTRGYISAENLKVGDLLVYQDEETGENRTDPVESIRIVKLKKPLPVYNLAVDSNENYYVAGANEFGDDITNKRFYKVHNCSFGADFIPFVGGAKGITEALIGKDLFTNEELSLINRCFAAGAVIPGAGPAMKKMAKAIKIAKNGAKDVKAASKLSKIEKNIANIGSNKVSNSNSGAKNRAQHERYKQELRNQEVILEPGKQAKHTPGHNNYKPGKSVAGHKNPQELLDRSAGTGKAVQGTKGQPGYKEVVDFKEDIGWFVDQKTGEAFRTTRGTIHYSKDGAHIVPAHPVGQ